MGTFTLFIHIKTIVSYLTKNDYSCAILILSIFSIIIFWVITLVFLLNPDYHSSIAFTYCCSGYDVSTYFILILTFKVHAVEPSPSFLAYSHTCGTDQVVPAGVMDHPPFLHHCAAPPLCVLDGLYHPHQWDIIACGWTDCLNSLLISLHIEISRVEEEHFVFRRGWLLWVIQAPTALTVHIITVNIHWHVCISSQTGRFSIEGDLAKAVSWYFRCAAFMAVEFAIFTLHSLAKEAFQQPLAVLAYCWTAVRVDSKRVWNFDPAHYHLFHPDWTTTPGWDSLTGLLVSMWLFTEKGHTFRLQGSWNWETRSRQRYIWQTSLSYSTAVIWNLEGTSFMII